MHPSVGSELHSNYCQMWACVKYNVPLSTIDIFKDSGDPGFLMQGD